MINSIMLNYWQSMYTIKGIKIACHLVGELHMYVCIISKKH